MKRKGKISTEGYRSDSPDRFNDFNIIPSSYIDMTGVNHDVLMIPMGGHTVGNPVLAKPGERYFFPRHDFVFEQAMPQNAIMRYQRIMQKGGAQTPEAWEKEIRAVEREIGDPSQWTMENYNMLQNKLNKYKKWRETTSEGKAVKDYHNEPNEYVVPMPKHLKKAYGGVLKKYQGDISGSEVPLNTTDFIYTPQEIEKYKNIYDQRIANCQKGDAACLEQANNYYNLYVAPKLNAPNSWRIIENMHKDLGSNSPNKKSYNSWDLAGLYKQAGAKVNLAASPKNAEDLQNKLDYMSEQQLKDFWINQKIPLGALVNFGQAGLSEHYGKGQAYNVSQGLVPSNHSARVVGYSPEGVPYIYDYGHISPITDPTFKSMPLTAITSPQEIQGYTFENLKKQNKLEAGKMNPLKIQTKGADYDPDEYDPFIESLQKNKDLYANALSMSDEEYNNYAKHAAALALTETGGGDDASIRWKGIFPVPSYLTDKMGFGDTKGITQINPDVLFGKKSLADKLESVGIRKGNYDPWNPDHAALATLALLKENKPVQNKNAKTSGNKADLSEAEKTYYQWSMPGTLRKGEAKGESEKIKRYIENYNKIDAGFSATNKYLAENRKYGGPIPYAQEGLQATTTYTSGKEQNYMSPERRAYEQALANQVAEQQLTDAKLAMNIAGIGFYPAAVASSIIDFNEGNIGQGLAGLVPFVGSAQKANTARNILNQASRNLLTKAYNAGIPYKLAAPAIKAGKKATMYGANAANAYDAYSALNQNAYGGIPDENEYKRGGALPNKHETNKNIKSSINQLMRRNETLFGPAGKHFYNPNPMSKYYKGGIAFPQQPTAGSTKGQQESEFYAPNWIPPGPVGFYEHGGIAYPQLPTEDYFFSGSPWMPHYNMGGLPGGANEMSMPCMNCGGYMEDGGMYYAQPGKMINPTPVPAMDADAWEKQYGKTVGDYGTPTKTVFPSFATRGAYDKFKASNPNFARYSDEEMQNLGANVPAVFKAPKSTKPVTPYSPAGTSSEGYGLFTKTGDTSGQKYKFQSGDYTPYTQGALATNKEGGFMTPDNMMNYPVFYTGGNPMMYADGGESMGYSQDDITRMMADRFNQGVQANVENDMTQKAVQNMIPYMLPNAMQQNMQAKYGAAYIPKAQDGYSAAQKRLMSSFPQLNTSATSQQISANPDAWMSPEAQAKKKAFYDTSSAMDKNWKAYDQWDQSQGRGYYAPGYQTMYDEFGNQDYRVGRMSRGMKNFLPYLMYNPQLSALKNEEIVARRFGPGARKIIRSYATAYDPTTGPQIQVPVESNKKGESSSKSSSSSTNSTTSQNQNAQTMPGYDFSANLGPAFPINKATGPMATQLSLPASQADRIKYSYNNQGQRMPNTFQSYMQSQLQPKAYGGMYDEGGIYELTEAEIGAIMAAGGQITYID